MTDPGRGSAAPRLLCPYREHALISRREHEASDVLLACQGRIRLAPSGHVLGLDLNAVLQLGGARCYDLAVLAELLPAADGGLLEALWDTGGGPASASRIWGERITGRWSDP